MALTRTFLQATNSPSDLTTYTFSSQSFGTEDSQRHIIVTGSSRSVGSTTVSSVTIGGESATVVSNSTVDSNGNTSSTFVAFVKLPTSTSGSIVVTFSAGQVRCAVAAYRVVGADTIALTDWEGTGSITNEANPSLSRDIDISAGGVAFSCMFHGVATAFSTTGLTEDFEVLNAGWEANGAWSGASGEFASQSLATTITTSTMSGQNLGARSFIAASFEEQAPSGETLTAEHGSYTLTGQAASLLRALRMTAAQGSYALTGQTANLLRGLKIVAAQGGYTLSGQEATLFVTEVGTIVAALGTYTLTGFDANTSYSGEVSPPQPVVIGHFDPLAHLPQNLQPTESRILALVEFFIENNRAPTAQEAITLLGAGVEHGSYTDPLPDGFAGRDWNNPYWLRRLQ